MTEIDSSQGRHSGEPERFTFGTLGRSVGWESFSWKLFPRGGLGPKTIAIFLFQTCPETQSGESGMFPHHFAEMVLGWRASFPFPNSKLVAVRKFKKSEKGRCHKRDHKRAVPKFKKVYLTKKLPGKNYPWCKVFRPEKPCRKNFPTCKLFHIPY